MVDREDRDEVRVVIDRVHDPDVIELGSHTPAASFADAAAGRDDVIAVVVTMTAGSRPGVVAATVRALREAGVSAPVVIGGSGASESAVRRSGADRYVSGDARALAALVDELAGPRARSAS